AHSDFINRTTVDFGSPVALCRRSIEVTRWRLSSSSSRSVREAASTVLVLSGILKFHLVERDRIAMAERRPPCNGFRQAPRRSLPSEGSLCRWPGRNNRVRRRRQAAFFVIPPPLLGAAAR